MFNLDWFCPHKHISNFSVWVFYLVVLNLPRHIRFWPENVIICGNIPRFSYEPLTKTFVFVAPLVKELKKAWNEGFEHCSIISTKMERFFLSLICVGCDIPASRKLYRFLGKKIIFRRTLVTMIFRIQYLISPSSTPKCLVSNFYWLAEF